MQEFIIKTLGFGFVAFLISASLIMCDRSYQKECKVYEAEKISRYGKEALRLEDESCKEYRRRIRDIEYELSLDIIEDFRMKDFIGE